MINSEICIGFETNAIYSDTFASVFFVRRDFLDRIPKIRHNIVDFVSLQNNRANKKLKIESSDWIDHFFLENEFYWRTYTILWSRTMYCFVWKIWGTMFLGPKKKTKTKKSFDHFLYSNEILIMQQMQIQFDWDESFYLGSKQIGCHLNELNIVLCKRTFIKLHLKR